MNEYLSQVQNHYIYTGEKEKLLSYKQQTTVVLICTEQEH